jgi:DNA repair exonuclease SbcCD ATPase subunit
MDAFAGPYNKLAEDRSAVSQLNIRHFLTAGQTVIEAGHFSEQQCPFCLTPYQLEQLREEVDARIQNIAKIQDRYEETKTSKAAFIQTIDMLIVACKPLAANYDDLGKFKTLTTEAPKALATINSWVTATNNGFSNFQPVIFSKHDVDAIVAFEALAKSHSTLARSEGEALELSEHEKRLVQVIGEVRDLEKQFDQYQKNTAIVHAFQKQILALTTIFDRFVPVQNAALQTVLDKISEDVGTYYTALHPNENVDKVRLSVVGEEGIEFEYQFHGKTTYPPMKYLSESHLNSLGICLFLAFPSRLAL